jgi:hypothetical protein
MALIEEKQKTEYPNGEQFKFCEKITKQKTTDSLITHLTSTIPLITTESYKLFANWTLQLLDNLCKRASSIESSDSSMASTSDFVMKPFDDGVKDQAKEKRKIQTKAKAEQRRLKMLSQMSNMQKDFIKKNKDFFEETPFEAEISGQVSTIDMELGYKTKTKQKMPS